MALAQLWTGRVSGTNRGNLFVKLEGEDNALSGTFRLNDEIAGIVIYSVWGKFENSCLELKGDLFSLRGDASPGQLTVNMALNANGALQGEWNTEAGNAGALFLFPENQTYPAKNNTEQISLKLHTKRHDFGAVAVDRDAIINIADSIQRHFKQKEVVVIIDKGGTQQHQYLTQFKDLKDNSEDSATIVNLSAQESGSDSINRMAQVEFGPQTNFVITQSEDEAWVLGVLEQIKQTVRPLQRKYITNFFKKYSFETQGFILLLFIVLFPSIISIWDRAFFMIGIVVIYCLLVLSHRRYLPFATIYLGQKPKGMLTSVTPNVISWVITVTAGVSVILLATFLQGWLPPPFSR